MSDIMSLGEFVTSVATCSLKASLIATSQLQLCDL